MHKQTFHSYCIGKSLLTSTPSEELEDFVGQKFYLPACTWWQQLAYLDYKNEATVLT